MIGVSVAFSADGDRVISRDDDEKTLIWSTTTGQPIPNAESTNEAEPSGWVADARYRYIAIGNRLVRVPKVIEVNEEERRWASRPDPEWHVEQRIKFEKEGNAYAAALHRSFEHQARGVVAMDYNQFDEAYWHFVAAALLKPPVPNAVEIVPMKEKK